MSKCFKLLVYVAFQSCKDNEILWKSECVNGENIELLQQKKRFHLFLI